MSKRALRILYAAGRGDVTRTYRAWQQGEEDASEVAITYSGQFYSLSRQLGAEALLLCCCDRRDSAEDPGIRIKQGPWFPGYRRGLLYHVGQLFDAIRLITHAVWFRADVAVVTHFTHWFLLSPLKWFGIDLIPSLHCAFWPAGDRPADRVQRVIHALNGWFWRRVPIATIAVSPECQRQVVEIAGTPRGRFRQSRAQYRRSDFERVAPPPPPQIRPFRVLYAGRIEASKGVFELFEAARLLERSNPGEFQLDLYGEGSAMGALSKAVAEAGLDNHMRMHGKVDRARLLDAYGASHAVVVPTSDFAEGLNKVAVEAVLAGRPVVTNRLSNALEIIGDAAVVVSPQDPRQIADALLRLASDRDYYDSRRRACFEAQSQFYDSTMSWGAALNGALEVLPVAQRTLDMTGGKSAFAAAQMPPAV